MGINSPINPSGSNRPTGDQCGLIAFTHFWHAEKLFTFHLHPPSLILVQILHLFKSIILFIQAGVFHEFDV